MQVERAHPGQIRWVWRNLPQASHPYAEAAAALALEARAQRGDAAFWAMHNALFEAHGHKGLSEDVLQALARDLQLDVPRWKSSVASGAHSAVIDADRAAASVAGITDIPAFVINGYVLKGVQPEAMLNRTIRYALQHPKGP